MKRILNVIMAMLLISLAVQAKGSAEFTLGEFSGERGVSYVEVSRPLLQQTRVLQEFHIPKQVVKSLDKVEIIMVSTGQNAGWEKVRDKVRVLIKDMKRVMSFSSTRANVVVWGVPESKDSEMFKRIIIGVGAVGKLTYMLMDGPVSAADVNNIVNSMI